MPDFRDTFSPYVSPVADNSKKPPAAGQSATGTAQRLERAMAARRTLAVVSVPGITFRLLAGNGGASENEAELLALRAEVCGDGAPAAARQLRVRRRQPGFVLAEARHGGYLVAYASGLPLRPSTSWWKDLTTPLPDSVTAEYPGRTFALTELLVRPSWRRQGIGRALHDLILDGRAEERATLTVPPGAAAAQAAFRSWGWRRLARTAGPGPDVPVLDVLLAGLPL
jgi:GNAT superfamily N-acetyltransferase